MLFVIMCLINRPLIARAVSVAMLDVGQSRQKLQPVYRISRRISRVSGHQNRGQKIDLDLYEGHIISVVRLLIKNLACLAICSF